MSGGVSKDKKKARHADTAPLRAIGSGASTYEPDAEPRLIIGTVNMIADDANPWQVGRARARERRRPRTVVRAAHPRRAHASSAHAPRAQFAPPTHRIGELMAAAVPSFTARGRSAKRRRDGQSWSRPSWPRPPRGARPVRWRPADAPVCALAAQRKLDPSFDNKWLPAGGRG